jgi:hypothetical protein
MPLVYERDDHRRLIIVTVSEPVMLDDILGVVERQAADDTWGYAMLYDLRSVKDSSVLSHLQQISNRVKGLGGGRQRGPVGIALLPRPNLFLAGLMYGELTREFMSVEMMLTATQLEAWLSRNARNGPSRPPVKVKEE